MPEPEPEDGSLPELAAPAERSELLTLLVLLLASAVLLVLCFGCVVFWLYN